MLTLMLSLALSAAAPDASASAEAAPAKPAKVKAAKPKLICKSETTTRSRMPTRICKTQEQWDAQNSTAKDELQTKSSGVDGN